MKNHLSFLKKFNWKIEDQWFGFGTSPEADWKIIFVSTASLIILVIGLSIFMFIKIDKREIFVTDKPAEQVGKTLDASLLKETVNYYKNKALEFEKIKGPVATTTDPSI